MRQTVVALLLLLVASGTALAQKADKEAAGQKPEEVVLASVNGSVITLNDFQEAVAALPAQQQLMALQGRGDFLDSLVKREMVYQEAKAKKLDADPEVASLLDKLRKEVLIQALLRQVIRQTKAVEDDEAENFYLKNKEKFKTPERVAASHIVLKSEEEAKETLEELKKGKDFATMAKERSIGPRASRGGFLGTITRGEMPLEFDQVAFNMPLDTLSDVVKTPFGYHIIKVTEHVPPKQMGYSDVSEQIMKRLQAEHQQEAVRAFLDELAKKSSIEVFQDRLTGGTP